MAAKTLKLLVTALILIAGMIALSCDRRHGTGPSGNVEVGSVQISLSPGELRLPSPEAIDSVLIVIAVLDSEGVGMPNINVRVTNTPRIGHIIQPDLTDSLGNTTALFIADPGVYDTTRITATAENKTASALLTIRGATNLISRIIVSPQETTLVADGLDTLSILVSAFDGFGDPVANGTIIYLDHTGLGMLSVPQSPIINGQVRIRLTAPANIISNPSMDTVFVHNSFNDSVYVADTLVIRYVAGPISQLAFVYPESTITMIAGSGDTCSVILQATDANGNPVAIGSPMTFRNTLPCSNLFPQPPDTINGYAINIYQVGDCTGDDNLTAWIVNPQNPNDTIRTLRPVIFRCIAAGIGGIELSAADSTIQVGGSFTQIIATPLDANGNPYQDMWCEFEIAFEITAGLASFDSQRQVLCDTVNANINCRGIIQLYSGTRSGMVSIRACIVPQLPETTYICDERPLVTILPGPIRQIDFVYPESPRIIIPGSGDTCSVMAFAGDIYNNPVTNGTQISFRNNTLMGTLNPQTAGTYNGYAASVYTAGNMSGNDYVFAWALNPANPNDTIVTPNPIIFNYGPPPSPTLTLSTPNPNIHVGGESTQIIATLQDAYGNPMSEGYHVAFDMTAGPMDSLGRRPSFDPQIQVLHDTAVTNINGQAIVRLYPGIKSGTVYISACTVPLPPESLHVCSMQPLVVTILPGPPDNIEVWNSVTGDGNPNGPERYCFIAAIVRDSYGNPVEYGTPVYFSLLPPDIGEIDEESYTGGAKPYLPDSTAGVAYSRIIYPCWETFDTFQVVAATSGDSVVIADTSVVFHLPIFRGEIALMANPDSLWTADSTCSSTDTSNITATLTDGGGCPIEGGIINFAVQVAGSIIGQVVDTTDINGRAFTAYMIRGCEIPCDGRQCTIVTSVKATLAQKTSVFSVENITCSRPPGR